MMVTGKMPYARGLRTCMGFGEMRDAFTGPIDGELAVSAMVGDRAASCLDDPALDNAFVWTYETAGRITLPISRARVGRERFVRFAGIGEIEALVTDDGLDDETVREIEAAGVVRA